MALDRNDLDVGSMPLPANIGMDSLSCHEHRIAGRLTFSPHDYAPLVGGDYFSNIFQVVGLVEIKAIYGQWTVAGNTANGPSSCYFTFDDGAAAVNITDGAPGVGGVDCTDAAVGETILKNSALANVAIYLENSQCRIAELTVGGAARPFFSFLLQAKTAVATNYIRWNYTTAGAGAWSINWAVVWACRYPGSSVIAV